MINDWNWLERDYGDAPKPSSSREMELEELLNDLTTDFSDMLDLMADEKNIRLPIFSDAVSAVAQKLSITVKRDTVFKIWDRML